MPRVQKRNESITTVGVHHPTWNTALAVLLGAAVMAWGGSMIKADLERAMSARSAQLELRFHGESLILNRVDPGEFLLGARPGEEGAEPTEGPQRRIQITQPFYLGRYEVTQSQYAAVMGEVPGDFHSATHPVAEVTYTDAREFCRRLSELVGVEVTLPTEAQWEYAARAGTETRYHAGDAHEDLERVGWCRENAGEQAHQVGGKYPNAWGFYDVHGNVWELCLDVLPDYGLLPQGDPVGEIHQRKGIMRGGGWMHDGVDCRSARRVMSHENFAGSGFRVAINSKN